MINYKANTWLHPFSKVILLTWLIFTAIVSHEQDTQPAQIADTTRVGVFSTEPDTVQGTDENEVDSTDSPDSEDVEYFSKRTIFTRPQDSIEGAGCAG